MAQKERMSGSWYPPHVVENHLKEIFKKVECIDPNILPKYPKDELNYYNRHGKFHEISLYDRAFQFTPGWDQKIKRCDRQSLKPILENMFLEEKDKIIPVRTSLLYGRPGLPFLDIMTLKEHNIRSSIKDFWSRNGINVAPDVDSSIEAMG